MSSMFVLKLTSGRFIREDWVIEKVYSPSSATRYPEHVVQTMITQIRTEYGYHCTPIKYEDAIRIEKISGLNLKSTKQTIRK